MTAGRNFLSEGRLGSPFPALLPPSRCGARRKVEGERTLRELGGG
jgi:hypothetical protein